MQKYHCKNYDNLRATQFPSTDKVDVNLQILLNILHLTDHYVITSYYFTKICLLYVASAYGVGFGNTGRYG